jgi:hypothetical protein
MSAVLPGKLNRENRIASGTPIARDSSVADPATVRLLKSARRK